MRQIGRGKTLAYYIIFMEDTELLVKNDSTSFMHLKNQKDDGLEAFCKWTALEPEKRLCSLHWECMTAYLHHLQPHLNNGIQSKQSRLQRCTYHKRKGKTFARSTTTVSSRQKGY